MDLETPPIPEPPFIPPDVDDSDHLEYEPSVAPSDMEISEPMDVVRESNADESAMDVSSFLDPGIFRIFLRGFIELESVESEEELTAAEWILQTACPLNCALSVYCEDTEQDQKFFRRCIFRRPVIRPNTPNSNYLERRFFLQDLLT